MKRPLTPYPTPSTDVEHLLNDLIADLARRKLYLYRYETLFRPGDSYGKRRFVYAVHSRPIGPWRPIYCDGPRVELKSHEGVGTRCEAYRQLSALFLAITENERYAAYDL